MTRPGNLLAIYAHPDDEAFGSAGTFATYTDRGGQVTLVCATRGEAGEISDAALAMPETLGLVREDELRGSMRLVGVSDIRFLGYRDSGMRGTLENDDPRALMNADDSVVAGELLEIMRQVEPQIVLTFGEDGVYGHPDHVKIHFAATAATVRYSREVGGGGPALYYNAVPRSRIQEMAKRRTGPFVHMTAEEIARLGTPDELITTELDISEQYDRKLAALGAHRTQISPNGPFNDLPPETVRQLLAVERFRLVSPAENVVSGDPLREIVQAPATG